MKKVPNWPVGRVRIDKWARSELTRVEKMRSELTRAESSKVLIDNIPFIRRNESKELLHTL